MADSIHWRVSCAINARLGGDPTEPLCSRVWRQPASLWRILYCAIMDRAFAEREHCARIHAEWARRQEGAPCA